MCIRDSVYTQAEDDAVMVTARFLVGSNADDAATRVNERLSANMDKLPVGVQPPRVTVRGISDVPIVVLTVAPKPDAKGQWTEAGLDEFLASPQKAFPGNAMPFEGLKSAAERQKLICYLSSLN